MKDILAILTQMSYSGVLEDLSSIFDTLRNKASEEQFIPLHDTKLLSGNSLMYQQNLQKFLKTKAKVV